MVFLFITLGAVRRSVIIGRLTSSCPTKATATGTVVLNRKCLLHTNIKPLLPQLHHSTVFRYCGLVPFSTTIRHFTATLPNNCIKPSKQTCLEKEIDVDNEEKKGATPEASNSDSQKLGLVAKFKQMYKQYWYILVPVHLITSTGWLVGFYYMSSSGVDIVSLLDKIHINESVVEKFKDSALGHIAIAYLCYKVVTPLRYMVTLGGTTVSIKYLSQWGYIKPMPSKAKLKQMYEDRKEARAKRKQDSNAHE